MDLIKYNGLTGLSGSIFSLVDITGLFLFYDITYCLELMNKMRWNKLTSMTQESFVFIHSAVIVESIPSSK